MHNHDFVLHIETTADEDKQSTLVKAEGEITNVGKVIVLVKALEALEVDDAIMIAAIMAYQHRDEIPETRVDLSGLHDYF